MSLTITKDHPGGNIELCGVKGDCYTLRTERRDSTQWWFYFNFRARAAQECRVRFVFEDGEVISRFGVCMSRNNLDWYYDTAHTWVDHRSFTYTFRAGESVYFAFAPGYRTENFERFWAALPTGRFQKRHLGQSEKGRDLFVYTIGSGERQLIFTARCHACESTASYVLEGIMEYVSDCAAACQAVSCHFFPFMDIDGVEEGDQGKGRSPHDHNRDFTEQPLYRSVRALYAYSADKSYLAGFDLHSPWRWGGGNDTVFFALPPQPHASRLEAFTAALEAATAGDSIRYHARNNVAFGTSWNTTIRGLSKDFFLQKGARLAGTVEIPYFGDTDTPYTPDTLRQFGRQFIKSLLSVLT
ncbi:MAG: M14 family zinc carboxypeptidase [Eubacteriales bacterium]